MGDIMAKKQRKLFTKIERFLYKSFICLTILLIIGIVFGQTSLAKINLEVQKLKEQVETKEEVNQSLVMKINEMASLENIQNVSNDMGLAYNNENIKTIE